MYRLEVGLEHLFTGVKFDAQSPLTFNRVSSSVCEVLSVRPFRAHWVRVLDNGVLDEIVLPASKVEDNWPMPWTKANIRALIESNFDHRVTNDVRRIGEYV